MGDVVDEFLPIRCDASSGVELNFSFIGFDLTGGDFFHQACFLELLKCRTNDVPRGHTGRVGHDAVVFLSAKSLGQVGYANRPVAGDFPQNGSGAQVPPVRLRWGALAVNGCLDLLPPIGHGDGLLVSHCSRQGWIENVCGDVVNGRHRDAPSTFATVRPYMKTTGQAPVQHLGTWRFGATAYKPSKAPVS